MALDGATRDQVLQRFLRRDHTRLVAMKKGRKSAPATKAGKVENRAEVTRNCRFCPKSSVLPGKVIVLKNS
jgi:hypothetical protein